MVSRRKGYACTEKALPDVLGFDDVRIGDGARVTLGVADRVVRVWVDGRLVARVPHADEPNITKTSAPSATPS